MASTTKPSVSFSITANQNSGTPRLQQLGATFECCWPNFPLQPRLLAFILLHCRHKQHDHNHHVCYFTWTRIRSWSCGFEELWSCGLAELWSCGLFHSTPDLANSLPLKSNDLRTTLFFIQNHLSTDCSNSFIRVYFGVLLEKWSNSRLRWISTFHDNSLFFIAILYFMISTEL